MATSACDEAPTRPDECTVAGEPSVADEEDEAAMDDEAEEQDGEATEAEVEAEGTSAAPLLVVVTVSIHPSSAGSNTWRIRAAGCVREERHATQRRGMKRAWSGLLPTPQRRG